MKIEPGSPHRSHAHFLDRYSNDATASLPSASRIDQLGLPYIENFMQVIEWACPVLYCHSKLPRGRISTAFRSPSTGNPLPDLLPQFPRPRRVGGRVLRRRPRTTHDGFSLLPLEANGLACAGTVMATCPELQRRPDSGPRWPHCHRDRYGQHRDCIAGFPLSPDPTGGNSGCGYETIKVTLFALLFVGGRLTVRS